jgi:KTSC domain
MLSNLIYSSSYGLTSVQSSNLRAVDFDAASATLYVKFHSGSLYAYFGVPYHRYQGLMSASSKGSYLHEYIRNSYRYRRIS